MFLLVVNSKRSWWHIFSYEFQIKRMKPWENSKWTKINLYNLVHIAKKKKKINKPPLGPNGMCSLLCKIF